MKKMVVAAVAAISLSGGAVAVAALSPIGVAAAQDPAAPEAPDETAKTAPKTKQERRAAARARIERRVATRLVIAEYLGLTPEALRQELRSGKSLAEMAGAETQGLVELLTTKANTRIDAAVSAGKIDDARAATLRNKVGSAVERLVNAKRA